MPRLAFAAALVALLCLPSMGRAEADEQSRILWDEVVAEMADSLRAVRSVEFAYDHGHLTPGPVVLNAAQIADLPDGVDKEALAASLAATPPSVWQERQTVVAAEVDLLADAFHDTRRARWTTVGDGLDEPDDAAFDGERSCYRTAPNWIVVHDGEQARRTPGSMPHEVAAFHSLTVLPGHPASAGTVRLVLAREIDAHVVEAIFRGDGPIGAYESRYTFDRRHGCLPTTHAFSLAGGPVRDRVTVDYLTLGEGGGAVHYPRRAVHEWTPPAGGPLEVQQEAEVVPGTLRVNVEFDAARFALDIAETDTVYLPAENRFIQRSPSACPVPQEQ